MSTIALSSSNYTGLWESRIAALLCWHLASFIEPRRLGSVFTSRTDYECFSTAMRKPTLSFVAAQRLTTATLLADVFDFAPDLVIDVVGRTESYYAVDARIETYQRVGVRLIWVVLPQPPVVQVFHPDHSIQYLRHNDCLSGEAVLPGFSLPVASIFTLPPLSEEI